MSGRNSVESAGPCKMETNGSTADASMLREIPYGQEAAGQLLPTLGYYSTDLARSVECSRNCELPQSCASQCVQNTCPVDEHWSRASATVTILEGQPSIHAVMHHHPLTVDTKMAASAPPPLSSSNFCLVCGRMTHIDDDEETPLPDAYNPVGKKNKYKGSPMVAPNSKVRTTSLKWIQCDGCNKWLHLKCADLEEWQSDIFDKFFCFNCAVVKGPNIYHQSVAPHRYRYYMEDEISKPVEIGTEIWCKEFMTKEATFFDEPTDEEVVVCEDGAEFNRMFENQGEWTKVYLIKTTDYLCLKMPNPGEFDLKDVVKIMGSDYEVDTIDVYRQETYSMKLGTFLEKFNEPPPRAKLYNFLSLEFSDNLEMKSKVSPPYSVTQYSFVHRLWPDVGSNQYFGDQNEMRVLDEHIPSKPKVAEFCLAGMAGSYTDFHIDFGGSSVWYHIYKGQKIFYIVEPTSENLRIYEHHQSERDSTTWLGDKFPKGTVKRVVIEEGFTLMVPTGWIHAVLTPVDSLVFGGNYLHMMNVKMQLKIFDMETRIRSRSPSEEKFFFPSFQLVNWYAALNFVVEALRDTDAIENVAADTNMLDSEFNDEGTNVSEAVWNAAHVFPAALKKWIERDKLNPEIKSSDNSAHTDIVTRMLKEVKRHEKVRALNGVAKKAGAKKKVGNVEGFDKNFTKTTAKAPKKQKEPKKSSRGAPKDEKLKIEVGEIDESKMDESSDSQLQGPITVKIEFGNGKASIEEQQQVVPSTSDSVKSETNSPTETTRVAIRLRPPSPDKETSAQIFSNRRSTSGRKIQISAAMRQLAGDEIECKVRKIEADPEEEARAAPLTFAAADELLTSAEEKANCPSPALKWPRPSTNAAGATNVASQSTAAKKAPKTSTTPKQRMAKKMNIK